MKPCPTCSALCHDAARFCPACGGNVQEVQASGADPFLGHVLSDRYLIRNLIGEGGMGRVYEAEQIQLEKPVAVKLLHQHLMGDEQSVARFVAEAREASRLNHPNIVSVLEFGETPYNVLYLVMEFLRGRLLSDIIAQEYPIDLARVVSIFRQVLLAVGAAHELGVLHRDLKPDNIFIETLGGGRERVKVIDFGIAKRIDEEQKGLTAPGMVCGTPEYMSPEQVHGDPLDMRSDIYALGVILYEMLVGHPPFDSRGAAEVMIRQAEEEPVPPSEVAIELDLPPSLDALVLWALAKKKEDRIESAQEFRRVLDSWLLVSLQQEGAAEGPTGITCPSCHEVSPAGSDSCPYCNYPIPIDQPREGMPVLVDLFGEEGAEAMRQSRRLGQVHVDGYGTSGTPLANRALQAQERFPAYLPLMGREQELALAMRALDTGGPLTLSGEPGMGKSRLLDDIASRARDSGFRVIRLDSRCDPRWETPLGPLRLMVAELLGAEVSALGTQETLKAVVKERQLESSCLPGLTHVYGIPVSPRRRLGHDAQRREVVAAVQAVVRDAAEQARLALLLEDVDQMDATSQLVIREVQRLFLGDRLLAVTTTTKPGEDSDGLVAVPLQALGSEDAVAYAEAKQGGADLTGETRDLLGLAGGNPFFIEQLVRLSVEGGTPAKIRRRIELLDARLDRLPVHLRQLLQRAAIHGGRTPVDRLVELFRKDEKELAQETVALQERGLLVSGPGWVACAHGLVEEAVLAGTPAEIRREIHRAYLDHAPVTPWTAGTAVRHALEAGEDLRTVEILDLGASVAYVGLDGGLAVRWLQQALQQSRLQWGRSELEMEGHTRLTVELGRKLAHVLAQQDDVATADAVLREISSLVSHDQPSLSAALMMDQAGLAERRSMVSAAEEQLEQAIKLSLQDEEATWLQCELVERLAQLAARRGNTERALALLAEGLGLAEVLDRAGHDHNWRFQLAIGVIHGEQGLSAQAEEYLNDALISAERSGSPRGTMQVQTRLSEMLSRRGAGARAIDHLGDAIRSALELGDRGKAARLALRMGDQLRKGEDPSASVKPYTQARDWAMEVGLAAVGREAQRLLTRVEKGAGERSR